MTFGVLRMPDPHQRRWMMFVDGENFTIRAQDHRLAKETRLVPGECYSENVFVWIPGVKATQALVNNDGTPLHVQPHAIRSFYYTSLVGDDVRLLAVREGLWKLGFHPEVFKKDRQQTKAKGVDIALSRDLLSNAFLDNFDVAVLVAGDGDYVPLVQEVKRLGKVVYVNFFADSGLSPELRLASDMFFALDGFFFQQWKAASTPG